MQLALEQGRLAASLGEVPVGAVIARAGIKGLEIIASTHNLVESTHDATAHAEVLALRAAGAALGNWRLKDCIMAVTLEPCSMCIGAVKLARLGTLAFGAHDPKLGAVGSLYNLAEDPRSGPSPRIISGLAREESLQLLSDFFAEQRLKAGKR